MALESSQVDSVIAQPEPQPAVNLAQPEPRGTSRWTPLLVATRRQEQVRPVRRLVLSPTFDAATAFPLYARVLPDGHLTQRARF
jgi:hypothetical protein